MSTCASPLLRGAMLARMLGQRCGIHSTLSGDVGTFLKLRREPTPKTPVRAAKSSTTPPQTHNCGCCRVFEGFPKRPREGSPKNPRRVPKGPEVPEKLLKGFSGIFGDLSGTLREPGNASEPFGDSSATLLCFFAQTFP